MHYVPAIIYIFDTKISSWKRNSLDEVDYYFNGIKWNLKDLTLYSSAEDQKITFPSYCTSYSNI